MQPEPPDPEPPSVPLSSFSLRRYTQKLRLFRPQSASLMQSFLHMTGGTTPEFSDPKFPSYGEGREGAGEKRRGGGPIPFAPSYLQPPLSAPLPELILPPPVPPFAAADDDGDGARISVAAVTRVASCGNAVLKLNILTKARLPCLHPIPSLPSCCPPPTLSPPPCSCCCCGGFPGGTESQDDRKRGAFPLTMTPPPLPPLPLQDMEQFGYNAGSSNSSSANGLVSL